MPRPAIDRLLMRKDSRGALYVAPGRFLYIYDGQVDADTVSPTLVTLYDAASGGSAVTQPIAADDDGRFPYYASEPGKVTFFTPADNRYDTVELVAGIDQTDVPTKSGDEEITGQWSGPTPATDAGLARRFDLDQRAYFPVSPNRASADPGPATPQAISVSSGAAYTLGAEVAASQVSDPVFFPAFTDGLFASGGGVPTPDTKRFSVRGLPFSYHKINPTTKPGGFVSRPISPDTNGSANGGIAFRGRFQRLELVFFVGTGASVKVWKNGRPLSEYAVPVDLGGTLSGNVVLYPISFEEAEQCSMRVRFTGATGFLGAIVGASDLLVSDVGPPLATVVGWGDSYWGGSGPVTSLDTFIQAELDHLGARGRMLDNEGGTGFVDDNGDDRNFQPRIEAMIAAFPDLKPNLVRLHTSTNDTSGYDYATLLEPALELAIDTIREGWGDETPIVMSGLMRPTGTPSAGDIAVNTICRDVCGDKGVPFIDAIALGWFAGLDPDDWTVDGGTHPTQEMANLIGSLTAAEIATLFRLQAPTLDRTDPNALIPDTQRALPVSVETAPVGTDALIVESLRSRLEIVEAALVANRLNAEPSYQSAALDMALAGGYWECDNISGATDLSAAGNNLTKQASAAPGNIAGPDGKAGGAISFVNSDHPSLLAPFNPFTAAQFTVFGMSKRNSNGQVDSLFTGNTATSPMLRRESGSDTQLIFRPIANSTTGQKTWTLGAGITTDWFFWALRVVVGTSAELWVNGASEGSQSYSTAFSSSGALLFGRRTGSGTPWTGAQKGLGCDYGASALLSDAELLSLYGFFAELVS